MEEIQQDEADRKFLINQQTVSIGEGFIFCDSTKDSWGEACSA